MVKIWGVYALIDPRKGKKGRVFYIGKGQGNRNQNHLRQSINGSHYNPKLANKIKKIHEAGLEYGVEFLFSSTDEKACFASEIYWIAFYGRDTLCNLTDGGEGASGFKQSPDTIRKRGLLRRGKDNPLFGKPRSQEIRKKLSDALKGDKSPRFGTHSSEETRNKLSVSKMGDKNPQFGKDPWNLGMTLGPQSDEWKRHIQSAHRSRVATGTHNIAKFICVDGITDSITATCQRIGMERHYFSKWMHLGYDPQDIADAGRSPTRSPGKPLFEINPLH